MAASASAALSATLPQVRRVRPWQWTTLDGIAGALFMAPIVTGVGRGSNPDKPWLDVVAVACSVVFVARRRHPVLVLGLLMAGIAVLGTSPHSPYNDYQPLGLMLTLYTVCAERPRWVAEAAFGAGCLLATFIMLERGNGPGSTLMTVLSVGIAPALAGYFKRESLLYAAAFTEEQARKTEIEVTARLADERMRIARELHDVVAHALSLITVQAGVAVFREHEEARLREVLSSVESTGRAALMDMRRLLGVLRGVGDEAAGGSRAALAPVPGLGDIGDLVSQTARAGLRVGIHVDGTPRPLPTGVELAAYRIVQESLTNVLRHAGTAAASVSVRYEAEALSVSVANPGFGGGGSAAGSGSSAVRGSAAGHAGSAGVVAGHGLAGMAERVAMYGGELDAAPTPDGGFAVVARFPVPAAVAITVPASDPAPAPAPTPSPAPA